MSGTRRAHEGPWGADSGCTPLGEGNGGWRLLLPATVSGTVALVDLEPGTAAALRRAFPAAITVSSDPNLIVGVAHALGWDGRQWPLRAGAVDLLVVDERRANPAALVAAVRKGGGRAAIVPARRPHTIVPYPRAEALERLVRHGWPSSTNAPGPRFREMLARSVLWRLSGRTGLAIDVEGPSLVDDVVAAVGAATSAEATLRGVAISGADNAVLRVGLAGRDAAVRLSMTDVGANRLARQRRVLAGIEAALRTPELRDHMPRELATGLTKGVVWRAETWHQGHLSPRGARWRPHGSGWEAAHDVAHKLASSAPTGHVPPGWARTWVLGMDQFGAATQSAFERGLRAIEAHRLATAWCHGDLWPGNIILGRGPAVVIDWEQARGDAPAGVDAVFLELNRLALRRRLPLGVAAARAVGGADAFVAPPQLGGVSWMDADPDLRAAVITAAMVMHALGPEGDRRGDVWARRNLDPLLSAIARIPS
jgi:hypothetical protein